MKHQCFQPIICPWCISLEYMICQDFRFLNSKYLTEFRYIWKAAERVSPIVWHHRKWVEKSLSLPKGILVLLQSSTAHKGKEKKKQSKLPLTHNPTQAKQKLPPPPIKPQHQSVSHSWEIEHTPWILWFISCSNLKDRNDLMSLWGGGKTC